MLPRRSVAQRCRATPLSAIAPPNVSPRALAACCHYSVFARNDQAQIRLFMGAILFTRFYFLRLATPDMPASQVSEFIHNCQLSRRTRSANRQTVAQQTTRVFS
jgi:hypothetical protein